MDMKDNVEIHDTMRWVMAICAIQWMLDDTNPDVELVITSGCEGSHMKGSLHYIGEALDFRTRDLTFAEQVLWRDRCVQELGPDYDVVLEKDHLHIEYQPKEK